MLHKASPQSRLYRFRSLQCLPPRVTRISRSRLAWLLVVFTALCSIAGAQSAAPVNVPTWRYDIAHAGQNTQETALTPQNVTAASFGKLFSLAVDGYVYAQPLYVSGLTMGDGLVHNVLFVATEHDSIYAFDADSNGGANSLPLWHASLLSPAYGAAAGATTVPNSDLGTSDIVPEIGITGTPAIDLAHGILYVLGKTKESGTYVQRLHAINLVTGAEQPNSPVALQAQVPGTGNGSSGGVLAFSSLWQMNRGALDFYNGHVYIPFGAHGDNGPWHGWVFAYDATTMTQTAAICLSVNGFGNGVWGSGAGLPIDPQGTAGRIYLSTGNGSMTVYPPLTTSTSFGDSVVQLDLANKLTPSDAFTPFNQAALSGADQDQGSGGVLMPPDQQGSFPHIVIQSGKEGRILVINRDNMGGYLPGGTSNTNVLQDIPGKIHGLWSTPAYWNGGVYIWGNGDVPKVFALNSGVLSTSASSVSTVTSGFPGASFVISSNGTQSGVAWAARTDAYRNNGSEILYAFDATNLANLLYESDTNSRDDAGPANKFVVPVVTNGKVYLGAAYQVNVYGLLSGTTVAGPPVASPAGGTYFTPQAVTLTSATPSASIYYTLDGSVPTTASLLYTGPVSVQANTVIRAIASAGGYLQSQITTNTYTIGSQTPPVTFTPAGGTYNAAQTVTLSDTDAAGVIHYTLDGSAPTAASPVYSKPISVAASETISATAIDPALTQSALATAAYVIQPGAASINFGSGFASVAGLTLNGSATNSDDSRLQLTTGGYYQSGSFFSTQPVNVQTFTTDFSFQLSNAQADGFTFTIQNVAPTALGPNGGALGYSNGPGTGGITKSVAIKFDFYSNNGEGTDSTGVYSNAAAPTVPAVNMATSGIQLNSGDSMQAHVTYDGTTLTMTLTDVIVGKTFTLTQAINIPQTVGGNTAYVGFTAGTGGLTSSQKILAWTYASQPPAAPTAAPVFLPTAGAYTAAQSVTLTSSTPGAVIHYTTDGSTPTATSFTYSAPFQVGAGTTTVNAIALATGYPQSAVSTATYVITLPKTVAPTVSPAAGTYAGAQNITLADTDPAAVIYYTLNGTTPTAASTAYTGPIPISASTTVQAIAIDSAMLPSSVVSAAYVIQATLPVINFPTGFTGATGFTFNGSGVNNAGKLQVTNAGNQAGSIYYSQPVDVRAFTSTFTFQLTKAQADGFTFVLQNAGLTALGATGGLLGYGPHTSNPTVAGIANSVAVKFDFYSNSGEGTDSTGVYTNGASPTVPALDMTSSGLQLTAGNPITATLVYDGTTLSVTLTDTVTKKTFSFQQAINIPQTLGATTGYVGFTGGTGGYSATQNVLNWTYAPQKSAVPTPAPSISLAAGTYVGIQNVTLTSTTAGAALFYTLNGSVPTSSSTPYTGPISIGLGTTNLQAIAIAPGFAQSPVATATYTITAPVTATPTFSPAAGTYTTAQSVTLSDASPGAVIYYTTDGTAPTTASPVYSAPLQVTASETVRAIALVPGWQLGASSSAAYLVAGSTPAINYGSGFPASPALFLNGSALVTGGLLQLTQTKPTFEAGSAWYSTPVSVSAFTTDFTFQLVSPGADGFTFTLQNQSSSAIGPYGSGLGYGALQPGGTPGIAKSVALKFDIYNNNGEGTNSTGLYLNGASPTTPATDLTSSKIKLTSGDVFRAHLTYDGTNLVLLLTDTVTNASFTGTYPINLPSTLGASTAYAGFTGGTGSLTVAANILNWSFTNGAGAQKTAVTTQAKSALTNAQPALLAVDSGSRASAVAPVVSASPATTAPAFAASPSARAAVSLAAREPSLSPAPGKLSGATQVRLVSPTPIAVVYYTVDGSQPTARSSIYHAPIVVNGRALTIKAFSRAPGLQDSPVITGTYYIKE